MFFTRLLSFFLLSFRETRKRKKERKEERKIEWKKETKSKEEIFLSLAHSVLIKGGKNCQKRRKKMKIVKCRRCNKQWNDFLSKKKFFRKKIVRKLLLRFSADVSSVYFESKVSSSFLWLSQNYPSSWNDLESLFYLLSFHSLSLSLSLSLSHTLSFSLYILPTLLWECSERMLG